MTGINYTFRAFIIDMFHIARSLAVLLILLSVILAAGPARAHGPDGPASLPYEAYESGDIPKAFLKMKNPLTDDPAAIEAGMFVYQQNCVMCHGAEARGNGHMAKMIDAPPADLRMMVSNFPTVDDFYFWIINAGTAEFGTPMPAFASYLSETEIWQVVTWMQAGFPGAGSRVRDVMHHNHQDGQPHDDDGMHVAPMPDH